MCYIKTKKGMGVHMGAQMLHTLTTEQLRLVVEAIGDGSCHPKLTTDPVVNKAIACVMSNTGNNLSLEEKPYKTEIRQAQILQGLR